MTEYSPAEFDVNVASPPGWGDLQWFEAQGFMVDMGSLYDFLSRLEDRRNCRGIRYKLVNILAFVVLAKLAGEDRLTSISEWVWHRKEALAKAMGLKRPQAPHRTTYSRILGETLEVEELEEAVGNFFAGIPADGQLVQIAIDGKTLRGSIPGGQKRGVHLMAAYVPGEGVVLAQVEVDGKENEIKAAPRLLEAIDLRSKVVSGDAMLAQRQLSSQVVEGGGEYVWAVKKNQPQLREDIATLFADEDVPENGAAAETVDKGHGRIEKRSLRASTGLNDYLDWPYVQQVFQVERRFEYVKEGKTTHERVYGITSLGIDQATPQRLLEIVRSHWNIENGLHYRRDETLREDWCHLRLGHGQRMMAAVNNLVLNLVLGLLLRRGVRNVPRQRRWYAARWNEALKLITSV
jgi:predicted transposase YbfD/YdcC